MYCEDSKGKRVDLSSKEYASCAGGVCGGWRYVASGCAPWNKSCGGRAGAWLPAAEVCRMNLYAKFEKRAAANSSSTGSSSTSSAASSSSSIQPPTIRAIAAGQSGGCPTECPSGCCPEENWFCCPDNLHCAETADKCPSGSSVSGDPLVLFGTTVTPSDYFDPTLPPMSLYTAPTGSNLVVPEWYGYNTAVYVNSSGATTEDPVVPGNILTFKSAILLGYDPTKSQAPGLLAPPEFTVAQVGNVETGSVTQVNVTPVDGATGYVFRFNGVAMKPDRIGPASGSPEGYPDLEEGQYQYFTDFTGQAMTAASVNGDGTGAFSEPVQIGNKPCDVDGDCTVPYCCVGGECIDCSKTGSWCVGQLACDGLFYISGCAAGSFKEWRDGNTANTAQNFQEGGSCGGDSCPKEEAPECCGSSGCTDCKQCIEGKCVSDCSEGQKCCPDFGNCCGTDEKCCGGSCCAATECCEDGVCVACPCDQGQACPEGQTCCNGVCTSGVCCEMDSDCNSLKCEKCMETFSGSRECMPQCPQENCCDGQCKGRKCCKTSSDCGSCETCANGECFPLCDPSNCEKCVDGSCVGCDPAKCETCYNGECTGPDEEYQKCCPDGSVASCCSDADCRACHTCSKGPYSPSKYCRPLCGICEKCENDACVPLCPEGQVCGSGNQCVVGEKCGEQEECPEGKYCCDLNDGGFGINIKICQPIPCCPSGYFYTDCGGTPKCVENCPDNYFSKSTYDTNTCECKCEPETPDCSGVKSYSWYPERCTCDCRNGLDAKTCEARGLPFYFSRLADECTCDCDYASGKTLCPTAAWDSKLCECNCLRMYEPCPSPLVFDGACQCKCPYVERCDEENGYIWNDVTCECDEACKSGTAYRCRDTDPPTVGCGECPEGQYLGACGEADDNGTAVPGMKPCKACSLSPSGCSEGTQFNAKKCRCEPACQNGQYLDEDTLECKCLSDGSYWDGSSCQSCEGNKVPNSSQNGCECPNTQSQFWSGTQCEFCSLLESVIAGFDENGNIRWFDDSCQAKGLKLWFDETHCECLGESSSSSCSLGSNVDFNQCTAQNWDFLDLDTCECKCFEGRSYNGEYCDYPPSSSSSSAETRNWYLQKCKYKDYDCSEMWGCDEGELSGGFPTLQECLDANPGVYPCLYQPSCYEDGDCKNGKCCVDGCCQGCPPSSSSSGMSFRLHAMPASESPMAGGNCADCQWPNECLPDGTCCPWGRTCWPNCCPEGYQCENGDTCVLYGPKPEQTIGKK